MSPEEQTLLSGLFERVRTASSTPRDREAESLIDQAVRSQPYAPYYLAQAVIVQEKGLEAASKRIETLEAELQHSRDQIQALEMRAGGIDMDHRPEHDKGGFLGTLFGSSAKPQSGQDAPSSREQGSAGRAPAAGPWGAERQQSGYAPQSPYGQQPSYGQTGPWDRAPQQPSAGGSFLRGAMGTAAGVAGGMLLANSLSSIFGNHMSSLGLGGVMPSAAPIEETTINNYYGDDAVTQASDTATPDDTPADHDGWQQADLDTSPGDDFDADPGSDDTMDV